MTIIRRFDKDIADMHSQMQLASNDLYSILIAFQRVDSAMAEDHLAKYFEKMKEINQKVKDLKINISLAEEEVAELEASKE